MGGGTETTGGGAGFGADGLQGSSGVVTAPKPEEGRGVPGALESRENLWTVGADETSFGVSWVVAATAAVAHRRTFVACHIHMIGGGIVVVSWCQRMIF